MSENLTNILEGYDTEDWSFETVESAPNDESSTNEPEPTVRPDDIARLEQKLDALQTQLNGATPEYKRDIESLEKLIMPLLVKLSKGDHEYIKWPNRRTQIESQIEKILSITRKYWNG